MSLTSFIIMLVVHRDSDRADLKFKNAPVATSLFITAAFIGLVSGKTVSRHI